MNEPSRPPTTVFDAGTAPLSTFRRPLIALAVLPLLPVTILLDVYVSNLFDVTDLWPGYLFVTMWMATGKIELMSFASCAVSSLLGTGLALMLQELPARYGATGTGMAGVVISACIFLLMVGRARFAVNFVTMAFLTVWTIPQIQNHAKIATTIVATVVGVGFFGTLLLGHIGLRTLIKRWRAGERILHS